MAVTTGVEPANTRVKVVWLYQFAYVTQEEEMVSGELGGLCYNSFWSEQILD